LQFTYFVNTGPAINEAFANKQLDVAAYGAVPNPIGRANGRCGRILRPAVSAQATGSGALT
jgi:sulfonate transport system substrate-binding protein